MNNLEGITASVEMITSEMAQEYLSNMIPNRTIHSKEVGMLANDIKNNDFTISPDCICFDEKGQLMNGQHRLTAIVQTGITCPCLVARGIPRDAVIDRGKTRTQGEEQYMRGLISKEASSSDIFSMINAYCEEKYGTHNTLSDTQKSKFINHYSNELITVKSICRTHSKSSGYCRNSRVGAAIFAAYISGVSENVLVKFATVVNTGLYSNDSETAATTLRRWLESIKAIQGPSERHLRTVFTEHAIKDYANGTPRQKIYRTEKDDYHIYI